MTTQPTQALTFHDPEPGYSSRSIEVRGSDPDITIQITYTGVGNVFKAVALDGRVMPLLRAAPDMLAALKGLLVHVGNDDKSESAERARDAIARAETR